MRLVFIDELKLLSDLDILLLEGVMDADISYEALCKVSNSFNLKIDELAVLISSSEVDTQKNIDEIKQENIPFLSLEGVSKIDVDSVSSAIQNKLGLGIVNHPYPKLNYESVLLTNGRFDVYIKLSDVKYVKIYEGHGVGFDQIIEQFYKKGVSQFYLDDDDFFLYLDSLKVRYLNKEESSEQTQKLEVSLVEAIQEKVKNLGVKEDVINEVSLVTSKLFKEIEKNSKVVYEKIKNIHESRHFYEHCLMISYIAPAIAKELGFFSKGIVEKMVYAAIFHDISFIESEQHLAKYFSNEEIKSLPWQSIKKIKNHPFEAQTIVHSLSFTPPDIEMIILSHHERPDGTGFPKGLRGNQIPLIASLFIVAEDFVSRFYSSNGGDFALEECLEQIRPIYHDSNFKKVFDGLCSLVKQGSSPC